MCLGGDRCLLLAFECASQFFDELENGCVAAGGVSHFMAPVEVNLNIWYFFGKVKNEFFARVRGERARAHVVEVHVYFHEEVPNGPTEAAEDPETEVS